MQKILVRVPQWLGDAVVSTVFLDRLKARYPDSSIFVLSLAALSSIFESHPAVSSVISFDYSGGESVWQVAERLKQRTFDAVYILPRSFRTALEAWLAKIPKRIGFGGDARRWFLTDVVPYDPNLLYAHRYLKLLGEERLPLERVKPYFPRSKPTADKLEGPVLGMAPASVAPARTWEEAKFLEVANRFHKKYGGTIVLFGSRAESPTTQRIQSSMNGKVVDTAGKLSLPELGNLLSQCSLLLANDSGLMHVASAVNVPTVVLFGPSDPAHALPPWGQFVPVQHKEVPCVPCLRNECVRFGSYYKECMKAITVDETLEKVESLLVHR